MSIWGQEQTKHFYELRQEHVLDAVESLDLETTGRIMQLGSMENRVYDVETDDKHVIVKIYRPGRWSKEQIQDEHDFLFDLQESEIQVIAPFKFDEQSVFTNEQGLHFCLFPKKGGRAADEWQENLLEQMGRLIARVHNIGALKKETTRLKLDLQTFGYQNLEYILNSSHLPIEYKTSYEAIAKQIFSISEPLFNNITNIRIHGDCHHGNVLINQHPFLIDFDDTLIGPAVQDLWMIIPGREEHDRHLRNILINSYRQMRDFDQRELKLIECLRALRIIHFTSWISHRYEDDSFKRAFPQFGSGQYFEKEIFDLKMQYQYIQDDINSFY